VAEKKVRPQGANLTLQLLRRKLDDPILGLWDIAASVVQWLPACSRLMDTVMEKA